MVSSTSATLPPGSASVGSPMDSGSKTTGASARKSVSSDDAQNQQNVLATPAIAPDQNSNPLLLGLFCLPAQILSSDMGASIEDSTGQNSDVAGETATVQSQPLKGNSAAESVEVSMAVPESPEMKKGQPGDFSASTPISLAATPADNTSFPFASQSVNPDSLRAVTDSPEAPGNGPLATPVAEQGTVHRSQPVNSHSSISSPMLPVFTLAIRPAQQTTEPQMLPQQQSEIPQEPAATINVSNVSPVSQSAPDHSAVNIAGNSMQNTPGVTATSSSAPAPNTSVNDTAGTSATAIPGTAAVKQDFGGSSADSNSGGSQSNDRQGMAAVIEPSVQSDSRTPVGTQFQVPESRPVTEYAQSEPTASTHGNAPVTDIRLQVDGAANQHVNVRFVQQVDGIRVTVRSNDPVLTQSLQDRIPELTTRLDQHHYQTEALLPEHSDSAHFNQPNPGGNLQQDLSGRHNSSAGQGNSQNKQNQQQGQQTWDEDEEFSSLLELRR